METYQKYGNRQEKDMNIVFVTHYSGKGGANIELKLLIEELITRGNRIYIVMPDKGWLYEQMHTSCHCVIVPYHRWVEKKNQRFIVFRKCMKWVVNWKAARHLYKYFYNKDIQIVHTNDSITIVGAYLASLLKVKHIWHMREIFDKQFGLIHTFSERYCERWMQKAKAIIAISEAVYKRYQKYKDLKLYLVYDGLKIPAHVVRTDSGDNKLRLLFCGGTSNDKGFDDVLELAGRLKIENIDFIIRIAGSANIDKRIKKIIDDKAIEENLDFLGFVDNLEAIRQNCDATLMCSKCEAFGLVTIESMLSKVLVIGKNSGATMEIIEDGVTGYLYNTIDQLVACVKKISCKEAVVIVSQAYLEACERYSIVATANNVESIYDGGEIKA